MMWLNFWKSKFQCTKFTIWKRNNCRKTIKFSGMEDQMVVSYGCWKTKKLICGMEGKNVVAYDRQPFPARYRGLP